VQSFNDLNEALNYAVEGGYPCCAGLGLPCKWRKRKSKTIRPARAANESRDGVSLGQGGWGRGNAKDEGGRMRDEG